MLEFQNICILSSLNIHFIPDMSLIVLRLFRMTLHPS